MTPSGPFLDGWLDAMLGLPPQACRRFIEHEIDRDGSDWTSYFAEYDAAYRAARKGML